MIDLPDGFEFSSDHNRMDRERIHAWLSGEAYWALGRRRETQDEAMANSRNYGVFRTTGEQVAYARVVTDGATFAWLCDVFVDESVRGLGVGVALVGGAVAELDSLGLPRIVLATEDAHRLYERFGFEAMAKPENWMSKIRAATPPGTP